MGSNTDLIREMLASFAVCYLTKIDFDTCNHERGQLAMDSKLELETINPSFQTDVIFQSIYISVFLIEYAKMRMASKETSNNVRSAGTMIHVRK
jgi:hypothetical protein